MAPKRVWIDLDNTPHVPFFLPIIRELERAGHTVVVTARDAFQVCSLADRHGLRYTAVGRHYGANKGLKVAGTDLARRPVASAHRCARSPTSRCLTGRARSSSCPGCSAFPACSSSTTSTPGGFPCSKPALGVAPASIDGAALAKGFRYGVRSYAGLKEDVYAAGFRPDPSILAELGVGPEELLVTIRPPATEAHYHNPEADALYVEVVELLGDADGVRMVILPRTAGAQREFVLRTWPRWCEERRIILPETALDGLNLVWHSDLVVSGGGTMNREAAALGVPVYSIFRGKLGAVDRYSRRRAG